MNKYTNKLLFSSFILLGLNITQSKATLQEIDDCVNLNLASTHTDQTSDQRPATNIYADEMQSLVEKRQAIVAPYVPNNLWRTTFNGLKTADVVIYEDKEYHIAGLRKAEAEETKAIIRQQLVDNLPHDRAYLTNKLGSLYVKGSLVDADSFVQIHYGYTPGPLDRSGITEYSFQVETALGMCDKAQYNKFSKQIADFKHYMQLDERDRLEENPAIPQVYDMTQEAKTYSEKLREQAQITLLERLAEYQELRFSRLMMLANYHILKDAEHQAMLRSFSNQVLQYRKYLTDTATKMHTVSEDAKLGEALKELQSNSKRFYDPLSKFPTWFITKDETDPQYDFYKSWK